MSTAPRISVALVAFLALGLALAVPGSIAFAIGLAVFFTAPFALRPRQGTTVRRGDIEHLHGVRTFSGGVEAAVRTVGLLSAFAYAWGSTGPGSPLTVFAWLPLVGCIPLTLISVVAGLRDRASNVESIALERDTLTLRGRQGTKVVAYGEIASVTVQNVMTTATITIASGTERHLFHTPSHVGLEQAAAIRERVEAARAPEQGDAPRELRRPFGLGIREWLARVDGLGARGRAGAYRGGAEIDEEALFRVMTREDEDPWARAGAARVLASLGGEARARVAAERVRVKSPEARARIAAATEEDAGDAEHALERLDEAELSRADR